MVAPRFPLSSAVSIPSTSTCEESASASLPRASSAAALIASCGQKLGCEYPTATSLPPPLSGTLSTQAGTTMPSFHGFPHRLSLGGGSARFCAPAQAIPARTTAAASRATCIRPSDRRGPASCIGRPARRVPRRAGLSCSPLRFLGGELVEGLVRVGPDRVAHLGVELLHLVHVVLEGVHVQRG